MNIQIEWQGIDRDGIITYFDFMPLGISFMRIQTVKFLYVWLLFWVIGITWSRGRI